LSKTLSGLAQSYTYTTGTHRLASVAGVTRTSDANGNTTAQQTGQLPTLAYDDRNRLASALISSTPDRSICDPNTDVCQVYPGSTTTESYAFNGRGERVIKTSTISFPGAGPTLPISTKFIYAEDGRTLGEYSKSGNVEYIYLDNLPIGVVQGGHLYYVETDHLGTPREVIQPGATTASDTVVWKWGFFGSAFGENAPSPQALVFNLRFPGQYFDAETGLNYNYFRDYEPGTGRYVESDPIGLYGGINTYGYVGANPFLFVDRLGLANWQPRPPNPKIKPFSPPEGKKPEAGDFPTPVNPDPPSVCTIMDNLSLGLCKRGIRCTHRTCTFPEPPSKECTPYNAPPNNPQPYIVGPNWDAAKDPHCICDQWEWFDQ